MHVCSTHVSMYVVCFVCVCMCVFIVVCVYVCTCLRDFLNSNSG